MIVATLIPACVEQYFEERVIYDEIMATFCATAWGKYLLVTLHSHATGTVSLFQSSVCHDFTKVSFNAVLTVPH